MLFGSQLDFTRKGCSCASLPAALKAIGVFEAVLCFLAQGFVSNASYSELVQLNSPLCFMNFALLLSNTQTNKIIIPAVLAGKVNGICAVVFALVTHWKGPVFKAFHYLSLVRQGFQRWTAS